MLFIMKRTKADRARQFMPFDALKGYTELISTQEKTKEPKREPSEERAAELNEKVRKIRKGDEISVVFYEGDGYVEMTGKVGKIDFVFKFIELCGNTIYFKDIYDIK